MSETHRDAVVDVRGLTKIYPDHSGGEGTRAVDDVDFDCCPGEIFGLLGLNGAGKTTTLRMLSTALTPTAGHASIAGFDVVQQSREVRENIGFLSGTTGLYHRLTAREMISYFGELHGLSGVALQRRVDTLVETFGIADYAGQRCEKLSTGMKQKVNIARTVIHDPPVLVLDEPTSGLDVLAASTTLDFVDEVRRSGKCVIFSTHIMSEAERLCDRIAIIHGGTVRAIGTLDELRERTGCHYLEDVFRSLARPDAPEVTAP
ncbi:MAG TPA: ATP-binding cassette domain-containing protein [Candidatus Krumholzibacteria bacterium]|nr:ATP-binding cassette domain-containing protein [Candidatus Krumholzibacteria bacterium]